MFLFLTISCRVAFAENSNKCDVIFIFAPFAKAKTLPYREWTGGESLQTRRGHVEPVGA